MTCRTDDGNSRYVGATTSTITDDQCAEDAGNPGINADRARMDSRRVGWPTFGPMYGLLVFIAMVTCASGRNVARATSGCGGGRACSAQGLGTPDEVFISTYLRGRVWYDECIRTKDPVVGAGDAFACPSSGAKGSARATAPLRDVAWLRSHGGGEEAGGAWPGWCGDQRGVGKGRRAVAAVPSGPDHHHGGWWQGVVDKVVGPLGSPPDGRPRPPLLMVLLAVTIIAIGRRV